MKQRVSDFDTRRPHFGDGRVNKKYDEAGCNSPAPETGRDWRESERMKEPDRHGVTLGPKGAKAGAHDETRQLPEVTETVEPDTAVATAHPLLPS